MSFEEKVDAGKGWDEGEESVGFVTAFVRGREGGGATKGSDPRKQ